MLSRRTVLVGGSVAVASLGVRRPPAAAAAGPDPSVVGQWSPRLPIGGEAIHAALLRTGELLFFEYAEDDLEAAVRHSYVGTWDYRTGAVGTAPIPYDRDIFCAGMSLLADGRLFVAGGHDLHTGQRSDPTGVRETDTWDPVTGTWTPGPLLARPRWYPTQVALPDGRTLVFGGSEKGTGGDTLHVVEVESYDAASRTLTTLPPSATKSVGWYPRMFLVADGRIAQVGPTRGTAWFDPVSSSWSPGPNASTKRTYGSTVLLAGARKVLAFGGTASETLPPLTTAEVLDTSAASPSWRPVGSLATGRIHANAVVLPDGDVLAVGGGTSGTTGGPVRSAELFDVASGTWSVMASQQASRTYHSTALLLPDGRVFSAGAASSDRYTAELFSPPYLFRGPRPSVDAVDASATAGGSLRITSKQAKSVAGVALVKPGAVTHQINTDQRHVPLPFTVEGKTLTAEVPADRNVVVPGYYMLFLLSKEGVPSVASWVRIS